MASLFAVPQAPVAPRPEPVSGIRPVTLLIAFGIVLITGILIATGIAANQLRRQALTTTQSELGRIDSVFVEAIRRSLNAADSQLADVVDHLRRAATGGATALRETAAAPETLALLHGKLGQYPPIAAIALIAADGEILGRAGAWPAADIAWRDLFVASRGQPAQASTIGAPVQDPATGAFSIPLAQRIDGAQGAPVGVVVGMIPSADFADLFAAVPLAQDAVIGLLRQDGMMLARYPAAPGTIGRLAGDADFASVFGDSTATMVRHVAASDGERIEALRTLAGYPVAVTVTRNAEQALAGWARQGLWFGGFAFAGAVLIGIMVYLTARQFRTHATIAAIRAEKTIAALDAEKLEMERARLAVEAELLKSERLSVLGQLTATVAHELRNPLSAIRNTLFTIKELTTGAGIKLDRPIARMERSIERCDRIITDLLEYTRNRELNRTGIGFDRWIADVLADQNLSPSVVLATELGAADAVAPIDPDRVRRVIINLVENAAQALAELPPDRARRITVRTSAADAELLLAIEDTGPGMSPEILARIFDPLFSTKSFGTGLGLPTVKQIISQHAGTIAVDSEVGRGTCVTVRLPLQAAPMQDVKVAA